MTTETSNSSRRPTHRIFNVSGKGKNASWTPVGAAWPNVDGQGFSMTFEAIPLHGRIVMRLITERAEAESVQ